MHKINILQRTLDAAARRRGGGRYAFKHIEAAKTALLVIDMQVYFMAPGMMAEVPMARAIVPNINKLAAALRKAGGQVVWLTSTFDQNVSENWSVMMHELFSRERREAMLENLCKGGKGHPLWPDFVVEAQDWSVEKNRFSAFIQGSSNLEARLRAAGIDTVIITGTLTDVCCESTAYERLAPLLLGRGTPNRVETDMRPESGDDRLAPLLWTILGDRVALDYAAHAIGKLRLVLATPSPWILSSTPRGRLSGSRDNPTHSSRAFGLFHAGRAKATKEFLVCID